MRPADWSSALQRLARYETFEERLALSAQPLADSLIGLGPQLEHHYAEIGPVAPDNANRFAGDFELEGIEQHVTQHANAAINWSDAPHELTGVQYAYQQYGFAGAGQTVAVIDSGIAWDHVALGGGLGSGYRVVGGYDFAEGDSNPYDDGPSGFHGTHVAGIIGSSSSLHRGVAPGVDLVALRVFDDDGVGYFDWVEDALQWVHDHRFDFANPITTVSLSLGTAWNSGSIPSWSTLEDEFAQLFDDGIFVAVSAGNSFQDYRQPGLSYPAASPYVVPVASIDADGSLSDFSQRNARIIAAPGRSITSTIPDHVFGADGKLNDFAAASGTSMASPYVAGASALVRQAMAFVGVENVTQQTIHDHLRSTADVVTDVVTRAAYYRLNVGAAIDALMPADDYGSTVATAHALGTLTSGSLAGLIGTKTDIDVFSFVAGQSGQLVFTFDTSHDLLLDAQVAGGASSFDGAALTVDVTAGSSYTLSLSTDEGIGYYEATIGMHSSASSGSDSVARRAYELDQQHDLNFAGRDYLNWGGKNEKWLKGNDGWYFITPEGQVFKWSGRGGANGELVATLDASYYTQLNKLYDAPPPSDHGNGNSDTGDSKDADDDGTDNGSANNVQDGLLRQARELDNQYQFSTTASYYENWAGLGEKWIKSEVLGWVFVTPDGGVFDWNGSLSTAAGSPLVAELDATFHADPTRLTDPSDVGEASGGNGSAAGDTKNLARRAYELDQQLGLRFGGSYHENWTGQGEKWIASGSGQWYFVTPEGSFHRWNGSKSNAASSPLVETLDASFHATPGKLHDAPQAASFSALVVAPSNIRANVTSDIAPRAMPPVNGFATSSILTGHGLRNEIVQHFGELPSREARLDRAVAIAVQSVVDSGISENWWRTRSRSEELQTLDAWFDEFENSRWVGGGLQSLCVIAEWADGSHC